MQNLTFAKWKLAGLFPSGECLPVREVYRRLAGYEIPKSLLKQARRELGIVSERVNGRQYWRMP